MPTVNLEVVFLSACLQLHVQELRAAASGLDLVELVKRVYKVGQWVKRETLFFLCVFVVPYSVVPYKKLFPKFPSQCSIPDFTLAESRRNLK